MKRPGAGWMIAGGVIVAHAVAFYFLAGYHPLPRMKYIAPPNFLLGWAKFKDPVTNEKMIYQEFTVSTDIKPMPPAREKP